MMLRAFNGDGDAVVAKVRYNNIGVMEARIRKSCREQRERNVKEVRSSARLSSID